MPKPNDLELETILHLNGCQQRSAGYNDAIEKKDIDTQDMERLEKLTLKEVQALISKAVNEARIDELERTGSDSDNVRNRITQLKELNDGR